MIKLVSDTINREDLQALSEWMLQEETPRLTKGDLTLEFEEEWARKIGTKYSVFVNSGSSAILLALAALRERDRGSGKRKTIVVPNLSWATDMSSPLLLGFDEIYLVGCNLEDLSVDLEYLEQCFKENSPDYFLLVSVLGFVPKMQEILDLCKKYNVTLIEDVCESMGSEYKGEKLGTFGDASVFSFYFGHHLSTIEGGMINTNDVGLYNFLVSMRSHGWSRDWPESVQDNIANLWHINDFNKSYTFYHPGLNVRSTDLQAFLGLRQLEKFDDVCIKRAKNCIHYRDFIMNNQLELRYDSNNFISNFAYPVVNYSRDKIVEKLVDAGVECRPMICGSMSSQPFVRYLDNMKLYNNPEVAQLVNDYGFYLPNHSDLTKDEIGEITKLVNYS